MVEGLSVNGDALHSAMWLLDTREGGYWLALALAALMPIVRILLDKALYVVSTTPDLSCCRCRFNRCAFSEKEIPGYICNSRLITSA